MSEEANIYNALPSCKSFHYSKIVSHNTSYSDSTLNHIVTFSYLLQAHFSRLSAFLSELSGEEGYFLLAYKSQLFALQIFLGQHLLPKLQNSPNA